MNITEQELREHFTDKFKDLNKVLNGDQIPEIKKLREQAIERFSQLGFPLKRDEEYKYTPITASILKSIELEANAPEEATMVPAFGEHLIPEVNGYIIVFWNGKLVFQSDDFPESITLSQFNVLTLDGQKEIVDYLAALNELQADAFASLNTAFLQHGTLIRISKQAKIDQPLIIYHLFDGSLGTIYSQIRHLIIAEKESNATVVEINKNISPGHQVFQNAVSQVFLGEAARLNLHKVQTSCKESMLVDNTSVTQQASSYLNCSTITTGGKIVRNNLTVAVNGENCESHMNGLYLVNGKDHVDNHTLVDHRVANSFSNELYKGIIDDSATGVFNGKIYVQPDAQKTNAFQSNKNILLSDKATMNTKPQLEIWADDVKCSHGATTGQLDADQVFYLRARGLDEKQAKGLLLFAFATEFLENITVPGLQEYLQTVISDRLYHQKS